MKRILIAFAIAAGLLALLSAPAAAFSGFPNAHYPGNMYGHQSYFYSGPWGERMIYGGHGYFPNPYGYRPYGYRTYGSFYTIQDIRYGRAGW